MREGMFKKFQKWITVEEPEDEIEENRGYEEEFEEEFEADMEPIPRQQVRGKVVNMYNTNHESNHNQMKVVIVQPKKYDDVTIIADHLRQDRAVIVNLENIEGEPEIKKSIYHFMSGAVYMLDGSMQKVSKSIFILAPNNVDIDANMKKELESKAFFPWQR